MTNVSILVFTAVALILGLSTRLLFRQWKRLPPEEDRGAIIARLRAQRIRPIPDKIRERGKGLDRQLPPSVAWMLLALAFLPIGVLAVGLWLDP